MPRSNEPNDVRADEAQLDEIVASYLDRLNTGEMLGDAEIRRENPAVADEVLERLQVFLDFDQHRATDGEALGAVGDYTLLRQVGRGGMGIVYEARQNSVERRVALKILPPGVAADDRAFHRFMREARTAAKLSHPNIVGVHGMGQEENTPYYSMEFVEGETLAPILASIRDADFGSDTAFGAKGQRGYFDALSLAFADVADALQHAHSKGVIHRDIKPSNLILDAERRLRILDFGLARLEGQEALTLSGQFLGTPLYVSPEQARRTKISVDHRTDVYSLGATMYESLCGEPPFRGRDHEDTLSQIIDRETPSLCARESRTPKDLETVVLKCLRKDAGERYGTAEALGQDLRRFVRGDPVEARPQSTWSRFSRRVRRRRSSLVAAGSLLGLLIACAILARSTLRLSADADRLRTLEYEESVRSARSKTLRGRMVLHAVQARARNFERLSVPTAMEDEMNTRTENARRVVEESKATLERAIADGPEPERFEAHYYLAQALEVLGDRDAAIAAIDQAIRLAPGFLPAHVERAKYRNDRDLLRRLGSDARTEWERWWASAHLAEIQNDWRDAEHAYGELLRIERARGELFVGSSVDILLGHGRASLRLRNFGEAAEDFVRAGDRWQDYLEPSLLLAKTYLFEDKLADADRVVRELYERMNRDPDVALWIALLYSAHGQCDAGLEWTRELPSDARVLRLSLEAELLAGCDRIAEAIERRRALVASDAGGPREAVRLGWLLLQDLWTRRRWKTFRGASFDPAEFRELDEISIAAEFALPGDSNVRALRVETLRAQGRIDAPSRETTAIDSEAVASAQLKIEGGGDSSSPERQDTMLTKKLLVPAVVIGELAGSLGSVNAQEFPTGAFVDVMKVDGDVVNSPFVDGHPDLASGGLELFFVSHRPGTGGRDLYVAWREDREVPFTNLRELDELDELNTVDTESSPTLSPDGRFLYFSSSGGPNNGGTTVVYRALRDPSTGRFGQREALGPAVNRPDEPGGVGNAKLSPNGLEIYFTVGQRGSKDIYVARRANLEQRFTGGTPVSAASGPGHFAGASLSADGLTMFFWQNPSGPDTPAQIMVSTRASDSGEFTTPATVLSSPINDGFDFSPSISDDWPEEGSKLYFTRCSANDECSIMEATWTTDGPPPPPPPPPVLFRRGDCNSDEDVDLSDALCILNWLFQFGAAPDCQAAVNTNGDSRGLLDLSDAIYLLNFLFLGGPAPVAPYPDCGEGTLETDNRCGRPPAYCES